MDIEIDVDAIRELTTREYQLTRADIQQQGASVALARSQVRHDAGLAAAADASTLACKAGCFWCCYYSVDVRPVEIFRILDFVARELPPAEQARIGSEVEANSALLHSLDADERARRNIKCPFLAAGQCVIYPVRPQTCRNYHATDARGCQLSYEQPDNLDIDPEFAPFVYQHGRAHVDAFSKAIEDAGFDTRAYELNSALALAMRDPDSRQRAFNGGERVFPEIEGAPVELEFWDPPE